MSESASTSATTAVSSSNGSISINPKTFWSRALNLFDQWREGKGWGSAIPTATTAATVAVDACLFVTSSGDTNNEDDYAKLIIFQLYLFGYEVPDTAILFTTKPSNQITVLTSTKKAKILEPLTAADGGVGIKFELLEWNKTDKNSGNIQKIITAIKSSKVNNSGKRLGEIADKISGSTATDLHGLAALIWPAITSAGLSIVDISTGFSSALLIKDQTGKSNIEKAAELSTRVLKKVLLPQLEKVIDEEQTVLQSTLADLTDEALHLPTNVGLANYKNDDSDSCYGPIIQSGGTGNGSEFDLKPSAQTPELPLQYDPGTSIICQLGARYRSYCSNIGRTYFINPIDEQKQVYLLLTKVYLACKSAMKVGQKMSAVHSNAIRTINQESKSTGLSAQDLLVKFTKNCGFSIGLEFREGSAILNDKNQRIISKGMIFNLCVGFADLTTSTGKKYAVLLSDTILVTEEEPESLTKMPREFKDIAYFIGGDEDTTGDAAAAAAAAALEASEPAGRSTRGIGRDQKVEGDSERARSAHQAELQRKQREAALKRLASDQAEGAFNSDNTTETGTYQSYDSVNNFPTAAKRDRIFVDVNKESLLLPIGDQLVPFHINTVKNVAKQEENQFTYLRINFTVPDAKSLAAGIADSTLKYVSELTYRTQSQSLDAIFFAIKELRKRVQNRQKELEAKSSLVIQEELKISKPGQQVPMLKEVSVRPQLSRKKTTGTLTAHLNGLRYITSDKMRVDIIYANIKSAFYQPAEDTHQVLLHLELINPILLDKLKTKKTNFLQFYVEVVEVSEDLSQSNRFRDEDGLLEEQEERKRRKRWNERFLNFVKEVEDKLSKSESEAGAKFEFDIPYRELAFNGVPNKSAVQIMPTVHSLVALEDSPPLVLSLSEVEIANFERVQFGLRNFDLVFVWKDFNKLPLRIDSIPMKYLDPIKHWLNSCDIIFYESNQNILWKNVMKAINEDVEGFWEEGGWSFLSSENDDGEGAIDSEEEAEIEQESDFEPSGSDSGSEDSEEYETGSEEASDSDDSDASMGSGDSEESGEDWDELEKKAARDDQSKKDKARIRGDSDIDSDEEARKRPAKKKQRN